MILRVHRQVGPLQKLPEQTIGVLIGPAQGEYFDYRINRFSGAKVPFEISKLEEQCL
jgi:hypothetical protein